MTADASFTAIAQAAADYGLGCQETSPSDIPAYHPLDNDRALRAWYLPEEGFLDARAWLASLDAALAVLPNLTRTPVGADTDPLSVTPARSHVRAMLPTASSKSSWR